jgi:hypothetical protein
MAATGNYTIYAIKVDDVVIGRITDQGFGEGMQAAIASPSGSTFATHASVATLDPNATFTTQDVKTALGVVPIIGGMPITATEKVTLYLQQYTQGGTREASGCITMECELGVIVCRSVSAQTGGGIAAATFEIVPLSADGSTSPWTKATAVALSAAAATPATPFTLGGSTGMQSASIDTGITLMKDTGDDAVYPTRVAIESQIPVVSVEQRDQADIGSSALAAIVLTDMAAGGTRGSSPITFTVNLALARVETMSGSTGPQSMAIRIICLYNGTNDPLVVTGIS